MQQSFITTIGVGFMDWIMSIYLQLSAWSQPSKDLKSNPWDTRLDMHMRNLYGQLCYVKPWKPTGNPREFSKMQRIQMNWGRKSIWHGNYFDCIGVKPPTTTRWTPSLKIYFSYAILLLSILFTWYFLKYHAPRN